MRLPAIRRLLAPALIATALLPLGCGSGGTLTPQIAPGPWTFLGGGRYTNDPTFLTPINGLYGALEVQSLNVTGDFTIASEDSPGSSTFAACLRNTYFLHATGTAVAGMLTLDSDFAGSNHLHLSAQLAPDRQSIQSGGYTITGPCATTSTKLTGFWSPPLTGTYTGRLKGASGLAQTVTAQLTQGASFDQRGYIPVTGTVTFSGGGCTVTETLTYSEVVGSSASIYGSLNPSQMDYILFSGDEDATSNTIALENWAYRDPICGQDTADLTQPGTLTRN